ncbi:GNAT family N-acetyltransferase [Anatilimnocola floriformis]|uniref:GNAT family N-acetyltransferase n=1 Tax=Anatilimnocola floriformis TaxID=2948575 RepID=UPI0020C2256E|nr:GNAT family N-acetyltransferase [Anatilimnocola floriformis]
MSLIIRPFQPDDATTLRSLFLETRRAAFVWLNHESLQLADFDTATQDEPILVATLGEKIVGFVSWWPPENFVHNLFVDMAHQQQGIGEQLLAACLKEIGRPATLKCMEKNVRALGFYERHGWQIASEGTSEDGAYFLMRLS